MYSEFLKYDWEQLVEQELFISWITKNQNADAWTDFMAGHPEFNKEVEKAREVIQILQDKYEVADEGIVNKMWNNIEQYDKQYRKKENQINIRKTFSWAAFLLVLFLFGLFTLVFWKGGSNDYQFSEFNDLESQEALFILPSGNKITLTKKNSLIQFNEKGNQLIVNDSIIHIENKIQSQKKTGRLHEVFLPYGKKSKVIFSDGTVIWLNAGSRMAFPVEFADNKREVYLEGEGNFQVTKSDNPFVVKTGGLDIEVLGTLFNVSAYPDQNTVETVLINGSVSINISQKFLKNESVILNPNQKADFSKINNEITVMSEPDAEKYIAWVYDWLEYRRESLSSVLIKLERYYDVAFHLPPDFPVDDKISGKLDLRESLEYVMMILSDAAGIEYHVKGKDVFIKKKSNI